MAKLDELKTLAADLRKRLRQVEQRTTPNGCGTTSMNCSPFTTQQLEMIEAIRNAIR